MADPGFPQGRGDNLQGAPAYDFDKFSQKLHEIERIWTHEGAQGTSTSLRFATGKHITCNKSIIKHLLNNQITKQPNITEEYTTKLQWVI